MHISIFINIHTCKFNLLLISFLFISRTDFGPIPLGAPRCVSLFSPATGRREAKSCAGQGSVALVSQRLFLMGLVRPTQTIPQRLRPLWSGSGKQGQHKVCQLCRSLSMCVGTFGNNLMEHFHRSRTVDRGSLAGFNSILRLKYNYTLSIEVVLTSRENFLTLNSFPRFEERCISLRARLPQSTLARTSKQQVAANK